MKPPSLPEQRIRDLEIADKATAQKFVENLEAKSSHGSAETNGEVNSELLLDGNHDVANVTELVVLSSLSTGQRREILRDPLETMFQREPHHQERSMLSRKRWISSPVREFDSTTA